MQVSNLVRGIYAILNDKDKALKFNHDCLSNGQLESKAWLVDKLIEADFTSLGTVFLCAGWYGTLATMISESIISFDKIYSFDIDDSCIWYAETFNRHLVIDNWKFKASAVDILTIEYPFTWLTLKSNKNFARMSVTPDTIINTSCEHILDFKKWFDKIPNGTKVILQSNNLDIPEHVNKVNSIEEFVAMCPLTTYVIAEGKKMEKMEYTRYLIVGIK